MRPPFAVTLKRPCLGLRNASVVGSAMYHASTDSYTSAQNECRKRPCIRAFATCASAMYGST